MKINIFRRISQLGVLMLVFFIPILNLYAIILGRIPPNVYGTTIIHGGGNFRPSDAIYNSNVTYLIGLVDTIVQPFFDKPSEVIQFLEGWKGAPWSLTVMGMTFNDPLSTITTILASKTVLIPLILSSLVAIGLAVLLGRVFCSWVCPYSLFSELALAIRRKLKKWGIPLPHISLGNRTKYYVLGIGVLATSFGFTVFPYILPYVLIGRSWFEYVFYFTFGYGFTLFGVILLIDLVIDDRAWCRYFCPTGALITGISGTRAISPKKDNTKCDLACHACNDHCPFVLHPKAGVFENECSNCAICIDVCPNDALAFDLRWKKNRP